MIVDTHLHWPVGTHDRPETLLAILDRYGIDRAVVSGWEILFKLGTAREWNDRLVAFCRASEGRLVPLATVHLSEGSVAVAEARRCLEQGAVRGFKLHPWLQGESLFLPAMEELCRLCAEFNTPILFHDGTPPYSLPSQVGLLARMFPQTQLILGHGGILHLWQEALEAARQNENIIVTLCGQHPAAMQKVCEGIAPDRILFGTDLLGPGLEDYIAYRKGLFEGLALPDAVRERIMHGNAERVFKLT